MNGRSLARALGFGALLALPYVPFVLGWTPRFDLLGMILVTAAAMGAPGFAAVVATRARRAAEVVTASCWAAGRFASWRWPCASPSISRSRRRPSPRCWGRHRGRRSLGRHASRRPATGRPVPACSRSPTFGFAVSYFAARTIVPPLQDQDMDAQDTAYGLAVELTPVGLTDRSTLYFFAHPLLLHYLNSCTLLLTGEIELVRPPYDAAVLERSRLPAEQQQPGLSARSTHCGGTSARRIATSPGSARCTGDSCDIPRCSAPGRRTWPSAPHWRPCCSSRSARWACRGRIRFSSRWPR